jgi:cation-transporting ATPase 13A3/4/5
MALYSLIQFTTISLLYSFEYTLGNYQFLYIDLFIILPVAIFMAETEPRQVIHPKRPTASLLAKSVLVSLVGQILLQAVFQFLLFFDVRQQPWYKRPIIDKELPNVACAENTALFLLSCYQYIFIAFVFSVGYPYRKSILTNRQFIITTCVLVGCTLLFTLLPLGFIGSVLELVSLPFYFKVRIALYAMMNFVLALVGEKWLFPHLAITWKRLNLWTNPAHKGKKLYKHLLEVYR